MQRRKWDAKTKAMIVLEGLKGKPVAELCTEHQISQAQYYQWCDQFLGRPPKPLKSMSKASGKPVSPGRTPG
jgi:transposase-like protein